jgi:hypothetical protein
MVALEGPLPFTRTIWGASCSISSHTCEFEAGEAEQLPSALPSSWGMQTEIVSMPNDLQRRLIKL